MTNLLPLSSTRLAALYCAFALAATAANIGTQDAASRLYHGPGVITVSVVLGTGVGLAVKYALDKRYIFGFRARGTAHDARIFALYALMSVVTTLIFWGMEWIFQLRFGTRTMRYVGGALGLAIGYAVKYRLDKRYVFREGRA